MTRLLGAALLLAATTAAADPPPAQPGALRVATYNVAMYRDRAGQLYDELKTGQSQQAKRIAEVLRRVRPDVVLLNEFDFEEGTTRLVDSLRRQYLEAPAAEAADGLEPLRYEHFFYDPVNTGVDSGLDLDKDGKTGGPADAWGYGRYPGQYGMLLLSRLPINRWRTYRELPWRRQSGANWPKDPRTGEHFYTDSDRAVLRLSSKSFWDVQVKLPAHKPGSRFHPLHLLCSHPTPPAFDGPEDRNGCRNFDEIRMIAKYIAGDQGSQFPVDPNERISEGDGHSTLPAGADFVVLGDLNADPYDGSGRPGAIAQLLDHPAIDARFVPSSRGGAAAARGSAELNSTHKGDPAHDTSDFGGDGYGNLRVDYVLPSKTLQTIGGGIFWPLPGEPGAEAVRASDHRLVWLDLKPRGAASPAAE
ncbi:MAG: endonuclease/exonuclease/phosphatase family protein [Planctomycetota bacterium]